MEHFEVTIQTCASEWRSAILDTEKIYRDKMTPPEEKIGDEDHGRLDGYRGK